MGAEASAVLNSAGDTAARGRREAVPRPCAGETPGPVWVTTEQLPAPSRGPQGSPTPAAPTRLPPRASRGPAGLQRGRPRTLRTCSDRRGTGAPRGCHSPAGHEAGSAAGPLPPVSDFVPCRQSTAEARGGLPGGVLPHIRSHACYSGRKHNCRLLRTHASRRLFAKFHRMSSKSSHVTGMTRNLRKV